MALANEDAMLRSEIIRITTILKLILVAIAIIGYLILIHSVSNYAYLRQSLLPVVCYLVFLSMQPVWYFIGIQKVALNSALVSLGRIGPLIFLVLYIDGPEDLNLAIKIQTAGVILCCALSYAYIASREHIVLRMPSVGQLIRYVKNDYLLFLSNIVIGTYASLNSVLLGINSNFNEVATYAGIEKIFKTLESFISSSGTIFFASISRKIKNKPSAASEDINQIVWFYCFLGIAILVITAIFGSDFLRLMYGSEFHYDSPSIWFLMFLPLFGSLAIAWGNLGLLNFGHNVQFFRIILFGAIVNIILISLTTSKYGAIGASGSVLTATVTIAFLMRYYFKKHLIAISK
jgi:PST family polysaccharide transporter